MYFWIFLYFEYFQNIPKYQKIQSICSESPSAGPRAAMAGPGPPDCHNAPALALTRTLLNNRPSAMADPVLIFTQCLYSLQSIFTLGAAPHLSAS